MKEKIIMMPHANIQYSQLRPQRRRWVMKNCYEKLFDVIDASDYKIAFEASGRTVEEIARQAPEVLDKLSGLMKNGQIEPVASPYTHCMLGNIPKEAGAAALRHGLDAWERYTAVRPVTGWNPECGWAGYIPDLYKEAGIETLIMDADSFFLSFDEIRQATGLKFDVQGHSNKNHLFLIEEYIKDKPEFLKYLTNISEAPNGLKLIFRTDCMANLLLWYLMGATEGMRKEPVELNEIKKMFQVWKKRAADTGGFIMPYAEDAEYIGSSAYFYVKQYNQARFFEEEPESIERFQNIMEAARECGYEFTTPSRLAAEASQVMENPFVSHIENGVAWHGGTAKAWANTDYSRILDPVCLSIFQGIQDLREKLGEERQGQELQEAEYALEEAWVSDSRWPPRPTSPGRFNVEEALRDLKRANGLLKKCMETKGISREKSVYSPELMETQINCIEETLMGMKYFGE